MTSRALKLIKRLPGPTDWTFMVKWTIIHMGYYAIFLQFCKSNKLNSTGNSDELMAVSVDNQREEPKQQDNGQVNYRGPNKSGSAALAQARGWRKLAKAHLLVAISGYLYFLLKYVVLNFLGDGESALGNFRCLDCFLLGRVRFFGHLNQFGGTFVSLVFFSLLIHRLVMNFLKPKFKFFALEFLLSSHAEVSRCSRNLFVTFGKQAGGRQHSSARGRSASPSKLLEGDASHQPCTSSLRARRRSRSVAIERYDLSPLLQPEVNSIFYFQSPFDASGRKWILRLNRTSESWLKLVLSTKVMFYYMIAFIILSITFSYYFMAGLILSDIGFELSYPSCVSWLRDTQVEVRQSCNHSDGTGSEHHNKPHSNIYLAPRVLASEIRLDDIPTRIPINLKEIQHIVGLYGAARILADIIENHLIWFECFSIYMSLLYNIAIQSMDIVINANEIKVRLEQVVEKLKAQNDLGGKRGQLYSMPRFIESELLHQTRFSANCSYLKPPGGCGAEMSFTCPLMLRSKYNNDYSSYDYISPGQTSPTSDVQFEQQQQQQLLIEQVTDLQAIIVDHFCTLIRGYNLASSYFLNMCLITWFCNTVALCFWANTIKSMAVEFELLILVISTTLICVVLFAWLAFMRSRNIQLYSLITRAMAYDPFLIETKPHWITVLRHYSQSKPMHSSTTFNGTEVSWAFCLKLFLGILSFFLILVNFYHMNHRY